MHDQTDDTGQPTTGSASEPTGADTTAGDCGEGPFSLGCAPSLEELFQYMDGFLDQSQQAHLRSHLDDCGGCGQLYDFQTGFRDLVGRHCQAEAPADLADRIFGAIPDLRRHFGPGR